MTDVLPGDLDGRTALEILEWGCQQFGAGLTFATGLGVEGCCIIDLIGRHRLPVDVFTLDTGVLFPETYALWRRLEEKYGITIRAVRPPLSIEEQAGAHGEALWEREPDECCRMRKVEPLREALERGGFRAWVTAIRREQTAERAEARAVEQDRKFDLVKINPLVAWTSKDVWRHVFAHEVPYNPLHDHGYPSIGCKPCTSAVGEGEDPRAGRWRGKAKTECGLHVADAPVVQIRKDP
jgi:phosphoadenosine phosphosulfate reductase